MSENVHDIDKLFSDEISPHQEEVPPAVWDAVSQHLDKQQAITYRKKYLQLQRVAALLLLLVITGAIYTWINRTQANNLHNNSSVAPSDAAKNTSINTATNIPANNNSTHTNNNDHLHDSPGNASTKQVTQRNNINLKNADAVHQQDAFPATNTTARNSNRLPIGFQKNSVAKTGLNKVGADDASTLKMPLQPAYNKRINKEKTTALVATNIASQTSSQPQTHLAQQKQKTDVATAFTSGPATNTVSPINVKGLQFSPVGATPINGANASLWPIVATPHKAAGSTRRFALTAFAAPNAAIEHLEDDKQLAGPGRNRQEAHRDEKERHSLTTGLLVSYQLSNKIAVQTGVTYTTSHSRIAPKIIYARPDVNGDTRYELHCSAGYSYIAPKTGAAPAVGDSVRTLGSTSSLSYISVPAMLSLRLQGGKLSLNAIAGIAANFLTGGKTNTALATASNNETSVTRISGLRSLYADARIGVGAQYAISKNLAISLQPMARIAVTPINQNTPVKSYPSFMSFETGLRIGL